MTNQYTCPACGVRLPPGILESLCPACALAAVLDAEAAKAPGPRSAPIREAGRPTAPGHRTGPQPEAPRPTAVPAKPPEEPPVARRVEPPLAPPALAEPEPPPAEKAEPPPAALLEVKPTRPAAPLVGPPPHAPPWAPPERAPIEERHPPPALDADSTATEPQPTSVAEPAESQPETPAETAPLEPAAPVLEESPETPPVEVPEIHPPPIPEAVPAEQPATLPTEREAVQPTEREAARLTEREETPPAPPEPAPPEEPPAPAAQRFGDYDLLEEIGRGGTGVVYRARRRSLDRIVALKIVLPEVGEDAARRFHSGATAAAALQHPNIVQIHEVGAAEGQSYVSMDYVAGRSLAEVIRDGPLPARRAATYVHKIAEAVQHAHQHGILHRGLAPTNILIDESDQPRVTDFGLARRLTSDPGSTPGGQVSRSAHYLAPEQISFTPAQSGVRPPTDVYGLGAVLYHLLTGRPPFHAETLTVLLRQVVDAEPVAPRLLNPSIPPNLETICLNCLQKEVGERYPTAQMVAEELGRFLAGLPIRTRPLGALGRAGRWRRRKPIVATLTATVALGLAAITAGALWQWQVAVANATRALRNAYAGDLKLAAKAVADGELAEAMGLLEKYQPKPSWLGIRTAGSADLRGWEWRYLRQQCQGDESLIRTIESNTVQVVALSSDGRQLAVRGPRPTAVVFDLTSGGSLRLTAQPAEPGAIAFSPRGHLLAMTEAEGVEGEVVRLWDIPSGTPRRLANLPRARIRHVAFSPDGTWLAGQDAWNGICLWNLESGQIEHQIPASFVADDHSGGLVFSPRGDALAIGSGEAGSEAGQTRSIIRVVELATGREAALPAPSDSSQAGALAWSADGRFLAAGYAWNGGTIRLWHVDRLKYDRDPPRLAKDVFGLPLLEPDRAPPPGTAPSPGQEPAFDTLTGHRGSITALAFTPDGKRLVSASADRTVRVWDLERLEPVNVLRGHRSAVTSVAVLPDGQRAVTGGEDGTVRFWSLATPPRPSPRTTLPKRIGPWHQTLAFTPNSRSFLSVNLDRTVTLWETFPARPRAQLALWGSDNQSVALSPDGHWMALGKTNGSVQVFDWATVRLLTNVTVGAAPVTLLRFNHAGSRLLAGTSAFDQGTVAQSLEVPSWQEAGPWIDPTNRGWLVQLALSRDDRRVCVGNAAGEFGWFDAETLQEMAWIRRPLPDRPLGFTVSPDSRYLVTAADDGFVQQWDLEAHRQLRTVRAHSSGAYAANYLPDGHRLLTVGGGPDALKLWDTVSWLEVLTLECGETGVGCDFSPDGDTLLAYTSRGEVHVWHAPGFEELETAERAKQAGPTPESDSDR